MFLLKRFWRVVRFEIATQNPCPHSLKYCQLVSWATGKTISSRLYLITHHCSSSLRPFSSLCISYKHTASGLLSWSMELLAFASRQFAPKIVDLSVRHIRIGSILPCERAYRREAPCAAVHIRSMYHKLRPAQRSRGYQHPLPIRFGGSHA